MKKEKKSIEYEPNSEIDLNSLIQTISPIIPDLAEAFKVGQENTGKIVRRAQYLNFIIMLLICVAVTLLAFFGTIDGSAATGLLGAIIGYVFGYIYSKRER
jgi:uncharacterized membrane protein YjjP (DUF1212 family)